MRRCRGAKGRFKRCGSGGGRRRRKHSRASSKGRHCRFGVNKRTKRCLKRRRARKR